MLATISRGPSGARSGSQTYSPDFSVAVSGETCTPSVKISAETIECPKISKFVTRAINKENELFMIADERVSYPPDDLDRPWLSTSFFAIRLCLWCHESARVRLTLSAERSVSAT